MVPGKNYICPHLGLIYMASTGSLLECVSSKAETTVCLANAKSIFSDPVFFNPPSLSLSLCPLSMALRKEVLLKSSRVCTANSNVPSSNMVLRESLSRSAGRYHFCPVELFLSILFPVDPTSSLRSILS